MGYRLEYRESVRAYLRSVPLTREGRIRLNVGLVQMAMEVPDAFRLNPENRLGPASPYYHLAWIFEDGDRVRTLYVVVDDTPAEYGVLRVVFADCR